MAVGICNLKFQPEHAVLMCSDDYWTGRLVHSSAHHPPVSFGFGTPSRKSIESEDWVESQIRFFLARRCFFDSALSAVVIIIRQRLKVVPVQWDRDGAE